MKNDHFFSLLMVCALGAASGCAGHGDSRESGSGGGNTGGSAMNGGSGGGAGTAGSGGSAPASGGSGGSAPASGGSGPGGGAGGAQAGGSGGSGGSGGTPSCPDQPPSLASGCVLVTPPFECTYEMDSDAGVCEVTYTCQCLSDHMGGLQCFWVSPGACL